MRPTPRAIQDSIKASIKREGESGTARRIGLSRHAVVRLAAGLPAMRGTLLVAAIGLGVPAEIVEALLPSRPELDR